MNNVPSSKTRKISISVNTSSNVVLVITPQLTKLSLGLSSHTFSLGDDVPRYEYTKGTPPDHPAPEGDVVICVPAEPRFRKIGLFAAKQHNVLTTVKIRGDALGAVSHVIPPNSLMSITGSCVHITLSSNSQEDESRKFAFALLDSSLSIRTTIYVSPEYIRDLLTPEQWEWLGITPTMNIDHIADMIEHDF